MLKIFSIIIITFVLLSVPTLSAAEWDLKRILILFEHVSTPLNGSFGDANQLRQLLGHFNTKVNLKDVNYYQAGEMEKYDFVFYIGYTKRNVPPKIFMLDTFKREKPFIWLNTGMESFAEQFNLKRRLGFKYEKFDDKSVYDFVFRGTQRFTKGEPTANVVKITDKEQCQVIATAFSSKTRKTIPYVIKSKKFWYIVDSPFSFATEGDRYLLFADMLHDILEEFHEEFHSAIIRIEDTNPFSNPKQLRDIADVLSDMGVPFLVTVTPFYVNPVTGVRVSMSDKPDYVDALHYMVEHGGTIVLHGTTHQYKGETSVDYEYWDESKDRILPEDSRDYVEKKLEVALNECMKNNIFPLLWETPHYSASSLDYSVIAEHFSTAVEQRLALNRLDQSQYFPYLIKKDMYGQCIYPENLGFVPFYDDKKKQEEAVDRLIFYASVNLAVRDGFASAFFHPFLDIDLLKKLIRGIQSLGYTFIDLRKGTNVVKFEDKVILSGNGTVKIAVNGRYLKEIMLNDEGEIVRCIVYPKRIKGVVKRSLKLNPGWVYIGKATDYYERTLSLRERIKYQITGFLKKRINAGKKQEPANVLILFNQSATGGAQNDQFSLASVFQTLNIPVEVLPVTPATEIRPDGYNLVLVPYHVADTLTDHQRESLKQYLQKGGNLITDFRNSLAAELGIRFLDSTIQVERVRDNFFPNEVLRWQRSEVMNRFEIERYDEVFAYEDKTGIPVVIGRDYGKGKFIFFGTRFDPVSKGGYSRYPYLMHYVQSFFSLSPLIRRDQIEVFFDAGFRHTVSIEQLINQWVQNGIRIVHVAGWHEYPKYKYDYERLVNLAHANGILVYAWLEPPQVSQKFWIEHPEWREKNYLGKDIRPSWRYPVALTDPSCLRAVLSYYWDLLYKYDWDGVNIAELYFEAGRTLNDIKFITPFHPSARSQFQILSNFDPVELFNRNSSHYWKNDPPSFEKFLTFRVQTVTRLHKEFLSMVDSLRKVKPGFSVVVTVLDSISTPEIRNIYGIDVKEIISLQKEYPFLLLVEDPESMWSLSPERYESIGKRYSKLVDSKNLALDLNILSFRPASMITTFPTRIQTGTECYRMVYSAALAAERVTIYSESSINQQDLMLLPYAYSAKTKVKKSGDKWIIDTPTTVVLQFDSEIQEIWINGKKINTIGEGRFLLPRGFYEVQIPSKNLIPFQADILNTRILSITGELLSETDSRRSVFFHYRSPNRCIVTLSKEPLAVFIDGVEKEYKALKGSGRYGLLLPSGEHKAMIVVESRVSYGVDFTSFWSSSIIVAFGIISCSILLCFYTYIRLRY